MQRFFAAALLLGLAAAAYAHGFSTPHHHLGKDKLCDPRPDDALTDADVHIHPDPVQSGKNIDMMTAASSRLVRERCTIIMYTYSDPTPAVVRKPCHGGGGAAGTAGRG